MTAERKKEKSDTLIRLQKNIERSMEANQSNIKSYNASRDLFLKSTLSTKQRNSLNALNKPVLEIPYGSAFLNRLRGEFIDNCPSIYCHIAEGSKVDDQLEQVREICQGHIRYVMEEARKNGVFSEIFFEMISGGFSCSKVIAEYEKGVTFNQKISWKKVFSPTQTGYDVLSRHPSRKDSMYAFELTPYEKAQFEKDFDHKLENIDFSHSQEGFSWMYKIGDLEIVVVADYYEKKTAKVKICELSNGEVIEKKDYEKIIEQAALETLAPPPIIVQERIMDVEKIMRYKLMGNTILEEEEVKSMNELPLVFFSGNSAVLDSGMGKSYIMEKPFLNDCIGIQKLANNLMITLADETQSLSQAKFMIAEESISPNYIDNITQPQKYSTIVYRAYYNNNPDKPNPQPTQIVRSAFPPEILALFNTIPGLFQAVLGSYDAQLGIANNEISGVAITQGAIHSAATAKPYIDNFMLSLTQVANVILRMIPKVFINEFSLPIINKEGIREQVPVNGVGQPSLKFDPNLLKIHCQAGVGSAAAKTQSMQQLVQLSQASPIFSQFINSKCMPELVDNLEIQNQDIIKLKAEKFIAELEQQKQEQDQNPIPNPLVMREQNHQTEMQIKLQQIQMEQKV